MKNLSVIIVNWNAGRYLITCVDSICRYIYDKSTTEIIVVDNNSGDGSLSFLKGKYPFVRTIENKQNLGFGSANNQGFNLSTGEYISCLNPDTVLQDDSLLKMLKFMQIKPEIGIAAPKVLDGNGSICTSVIKTPTLYSESLKILYPRKKNIRELPLTDFDYSKPSKVECVSGCCMMLRREAINKAGFFDEDFFMYAEDIELCIRMKDNGYDVFYYPEAHIVHLGEKSTGKNYGIAIHSYISGYVILKKIYGYAIAYIYKIFVILISLLKIVVLSTCLLGKGKRKFLPRIKNHWLLVKALVFEEG
ncbi:MAG: glycosyltransferase family 2 protein [Candidatus Aureabacteria bacterium]|nr:glycosyltransferase family 2 protein [Candidatus Auribacterota bacterium]